jgi:hypothetical protein
MLFKNPVRTSKRTLHFTITEINWLTLFNEIITVYSENRMKTQSAQLRMLKAGGSQDWNEGPLQIHPVVVVVVVVAVVYLTTLFSNSEYTTSNERVKSK